MTFCTESNNYFRADGSVSKEPRVCRQNGN